MEIYSAYCILYKKKRMCSSDIQLQNEWTEVDPSPSHAMHLLPWNPPKVARPTAHQYSCHIYICMTSIQPYQKSCILFQTNRHAQSHRHGLCELQPPHPTCPNPDSADLYQAVLVNMPWGMKLANICAHCVWGCSHVGCPCAARSSSRIVGLMETRNQSSGWRENDGQTGVDG